MFIVDNDMMISDKLPTAVDYTNILVNYLEVSYDDIERQQAANAASAAEKPADAPALTEEQSTAQPPQDPPSPEVPIVKPPTAEIPNTKLPEPEKRYHSRIPQYLLDLDAPEESSRFARANAAAGNLPTPPSLPMFLSKSILNGTTPMKDDSSVLIMPNHTVLNHLATSSIKDNVLATSATTRYKQKVSLQSTIHETKFFANCVIVLDNDHVQTKRGARRGVLMLRRASAQIVVGRTTSDGILAPAWAGFGV
jgi:hypothetical protein